MLTSTNTNIDKEILYKFILQIADDRLILGHRLSEWCGHGPILEEDLAMANIGLDLLGQASLLYQYGAELKGENWDEDRIAYFRNDREFLNVQLVEQPNGDFAQTMLRQFFFDVYAFYYFQELTKSKDEELASIANKSLKEVTYHMRHSGEWIVRLGDGTEESARRLSEALEDIWMYTGELFEMTKEDKDLLEIGISVDKSIVKQKWDFTIEQVFQKAKLAVPQGAFMQSGGRRGIHTEHLGYILNDMQFLRRSMPDAEW